MLSQSSFYVEKQRLDDERICKTGHDRTTEHDLGRIEISYSMNK